MVGGRGDGERARDHEECVCGGEGAASSCVGEELLSFVEIEVWTAIVRVPQRLEVMRNDFHNLHQVGKR